MKNHLNILEALLADVSGNIAMGNSKNAAGYLKSLSLLAGAMSRQHQQKFELDVIEELHELAPTGDASEGLKTKRRLNQRELELSTLETELADYAAAVSSSCFLCAADAASALRHIADDIEKLEGSELFPKPMTKDEMKAWAESNGMQFVDSSERSSIIDELVAASKAKKSGKAKRTPGARRDQ